ncbi:hypothetical protein N9875_00010 [bacterium]|nr:hypothetical protein [bacterium]
MDYFNTGLILGCISTIVFLILTLKNRWFKDNALEDLFDWWDGKPYYGIDVVRIILFLFGVLILAPLVISLVWAFLLPAGVIIFIILKIRQRNINKNNNN